MGLSVFVCHGDVHSVRMDLDFRLIRDEGVGQTTFLRNLKRIADAHIVGGKAHDAAEERTVGSMSMIGLGEGAVQGEISPDDVSTDHFLGEETDAGSCLPCENWRDRSCLVQVHRKH